MIEEDYTHNLADKLKQGELDAIIVSTPFEQAAVTTVPLYSEPFVAVLPQQHPLAKKKKLKMEELIDETLFLLKTGNCFRDQVMNACSSCHNLAFAKDKIQKTLEGSSIATIRQMVASGVGITILPCTAISEYDEMQDLLAYRDFTKPAPSRDVVLAHRSSYPRSAIIEMLKETISQCQLSGVSKYL